MLTDKNKQARRTGEIAGTVAGNMVVVQLVAIRVFDYLQARGISLSDVEQVTLIAMASAALQTLWYNGKKFAQKYLAVK